MRPVCNLHVRNAREHLRYAAIAAEERNYFEVRVALRAAIAELRQARDSMAKAEPERLVVEELTNAALVSLLFIDGFQHSLE